MVSVQAPMLEVNYILQAPRSGATRTSESNPSLAIGSIQSTNPVGAPVFESNPQIGDSSISDAQQQQQEIGGAMQESGYHSNQSNLSTSVGSNEGQIADQVFGSSFSSSGAVFCKYWFIQLRFVSSPYIYLLSIHL